MQRRRLGLLPAPAVDSEPFSTCRDGWVVELQDSQATNRSHAKIRALVEQAMATLKTWRLLRNLRCSTTRITSLVQAVLTLHLTCSN